MKASRVFSATITFLLGILFASLDPIRQRLSQLPIVEYMNENLYLVLRHGAHITRCYDIFAEYPLAPVMYVPSMPKIEHPIVGLDHLTLAGRAHFNTKRVEMWHETFASGSKTPIHTHDCEEIFWVYNGSAGVVKMQDYDGTVVEIAVQQNSTFTVPPNTRHQFLNTGTDIVQLIVAIDRPPMVPTFFRNWSDAKSEGKLLFPLPWDAACPPTGPPRVHQNGKTRHHGTEL